MKYCNNYTKNIKLVFTGIKVTKKTKKIFLDLNKVFESKKDINNNIFDGQKRFKNE